MNKVETMAKLIHSKGHGGIFGITQSGKTYYALQHFMTNNRHAIFINWQHIPVKFTTKSRNIKECISQLNTYTKTIYYPNTEEDVNNLLSFIYTTYRHKQYYPITIYADEADKYSELPGLQDIITKGMRFGIECIVISQRPQMLANRNILDNLYYMILFRHSNQFWRTLIERYRCDIGQADIDYLNNNKYSALYYDYDKLIRL